MRFPSSLALLVAFVAGAVAAAPTTVTVRDAQGPLADAVVALEPADSNPPPVTAAATIDQVNKQFRPRVTVVRTGTAIDFPNSDRIRHEVYSFSKPKVFTLKLYAGRAAAPVVFDRAGLVVLGCNIHDKMSAFVAVVDTPYFGKSDATGRVTLAAPPGKYRLRVWHPDLEKPVPLEPVTIGADAKPIEVEVSRLATPLTVTPWAE